MKSLNIVVNNFKLPSLVVLVLLVAAHACTTEPPKVARYYAVQVPDEPGRITDTIVINTSGDSVWLEETLMFGYIDGVKIHLPNQWQVVVYGRHPINGEIDFESHSWKRGRFNLSVLDSITMLPRAKVQFDLTRVD